jgi:DNA-binding LacI/PurR family transcriptional regulator
MGRPKGTAVMYREIARQLQSRIQKEGWPAGFLLPSYSELAAEYHASTLTVRRALACLAREQRIALTPSRKWVVRDIARSIAFQANRVAFISSANLSHYSKDEVFRLIREGVESALSELHWHIQYIGRYVYNTRINKMVVPGLAEEILQGVLLHGVFSKQCQRDYGALSLPVVLIDAAPGSDRISSVSIDNESAYFDATTRMFDMGHRRIAFCRSIIPNLAEIDSDSLERQAGFLRGLGARGIPDGKSHIFNFISAQSNKAVLKALLTARPRFSAVLAVDAGISGGIVIAAREAGLAVPKDLSIACIDYMGGSSAFSGPRVNAKSLGQEAVNLLKSKIPRQIRIPAIWHQGSTLVENL